MDPEPDLNVEPDAEKSNLDKTLMAKRSPKSKSAPRTSKRLEFDPRKVLFVGMGKSALCYYRCALPATFMEADWIGMRGTPPKVVLDTGLVKRATVWPEFTDYDVIVLQQPRGTGWLQRIRALQERGIRVVFEIDDYVHAIRRMEDHDFRQDFERDKLRELELNMRVADAVICSTEYIARRYRRYNPNVYVCENGLDLGRYRLTRPQRPTVNIGWAGGTGHVKAAIPWFREVARVMAARDNTCCVTIGENFANALREHFGTRALSIPWTMVDVYPAAMTMLDVAIAPAGKSAFFQGKSDLRWLEAGALGIPIVADPQVYSKIEHGVTGFHAHDLNDVYDLLVQLVDDDKLRLGVGANAQEYVRTHRDMRVAVRQWEHVLAEVLATEARAA